MHIRAQLNMYVSLSSAAVGLLPSTFIAFSLSLTSPHHAPPTQQRQQKRVAEENSFYFNVLQKALPTPEEPKETEDVGRDKTAVSVDENGHVLEHHKSKSSPKVTSSSGGKSSQKAPSSSSKHGKGSSGGRSEQRSSSFTSKVDHSRSPSHDLRPGTASRQEQGKVLDSRPTSSSNRHSHYHPSSELATDGTLTTSTATTGSSSIANGDIVRPSSAGSKPPHVHTPTGKKQATVRAVPRNDPPPVPALPNPEDKEKAGLEALHEELKLERAAKLEAEMSVSRLELEVKKVKADLQVGGRGAHYSLFIVYLHVHVRLCC